MVDPHCMVFIGKTTDYLNTKTAHWPTARLERLIRTPAFHAIDATINAAAVAGDGKKTKESCRQLWHYVLTTFAQQEGT